LENLKGIITRVPTKEKLLVGDFNGHVVTTTKGGGEGVRAWAIGASPTYCSIFYSEW
jgi:hypothetical protein